MRKSTLQENRSNSDPIPIRSNFFWANRSDPDPIQKNLRRPIRSRSDPKKFEATDPIPIQKILRRPIRSDPKKIQMCRPLPWTILLPVRLNLLFNTIFLSDPSLFYFIWWKFIKSASKHKWISAQTSKEDQGFENMIRKYVSLFSQKNRKSFWI